MSVFATGVTGVLGSEISPILAKQEDLFFLVRQGSFHKLSKGMNIGNAYVGDITKPMCGISDIGIERLKADGVAKYLHLAADVSFSPTDKDGKIRRTNFDGAKNALNLALAVGAEEFHFCGTAFAKDRRNPYEISKDDAEKMVIAFCLKHGIRYSIYNPTAIVGNYRTGSTHGFNSFIAAAAVFHVVAQIIRRQTGEEIVELPIYFSRNPNSTMNLVPVDWVARMFVALYRKGAKNEVYHLAQSNPPTTKWAVEETLKALGIFGINYVDKLFAADEKAQLLRGNRRLLRYQSMIDSILHQFNPYLFFEREFPLDSTRAALGVDFEEPPEIDSEFISRLIQYAVKRNFGIREKKGHKKPRVEVNKFPLLQTSVGTISPVL